MKPQIYKAECNVTHLALSTINCDAIKLYIKNGLYQSIARAIIERDDIEIQEESRNPVVRTYSIEVVIMSVDEYREMEKIIDSIKACQSMNKPEVR
jgi:hypothetical protein